MQYQTKFIISDQNIGELLWSLRKSGGVMSEICALATTHEKTRKEVKTRNFPDIFNLSLMREGVCT